MQLLFSSLFFLVHIVSFFLFKLIRLICILKSWAFCVRMWRECVCMCLTFCSLCEVTYCCFFFGVIAGKHEYVPFSDFSSEETAYMWCLCEVQHLSTCSQNKIQLFCFVFFVLVLAFSNTRISAAQKRSTLLIFGSPIFIHQIQWEKQSFIF